MPQSLHLRALPVLFFLFVALSWWGGLQEALGQDAQIRGFVYDRKTGEAVIYTPVLLRGTSLGAITDLNGYFSIGRIPPGTYTLVASSLGYDTTREEVTLAPNQQLRRNLFLNEASREMETVVVEGRKSQFVRENTVAISVTQITPREIRSVPSVGGEPDLVQYIQTLPGVVSTGDQGGQIFIRGGTVAQNMTLLDGMIVYNPFHSIGLYSVFDSDLLKTADFYTAGFGPEYGGRTSSIIDARTIDGAKNRMQLRASLNTTAAKLSLNGPLYKNDNGFTLTYILSGRYSYLDRIGPTIYPYAEGSGRSLAFSFQDYYAKVTATAASGSKVSVFGFNFNDRASIGPPNDVSWTNSGAGMNFLVLPGGGSTLLNATLAFSNYDIQIREATVLPRSSQVGGFNGSLDFTYFLGRSEFRYGLGVVGNNTSYRSALPTSSDRGQAVDFTAFNTEFDAYVRWRINTNRLILDPGFRFQYYASLNEFSPEPRLGAKYTLTDRVRLKGAVGRYSQNLVSTRSDRDVVNLFAGYISSPDRVDDASGQPVRQLIERATHFVAGVEFDPTPEIEMTLEPYLKIFDPYIGINREKLFASDADFIAEGGRAEGIDLAIRYDRRPFTMQVSYSLARVQRSFGGVTYAPNFDRRHNLTLLGGWQAVRGPRPLEINARFSLGTGLPFTQTQAFFEDLPIGGGINQDLIGQNGGLGIFYGSINDFNRGRLPIFHRMDISVKKRFPLNTDGGALEVSAGATNVYNRANIFYVDRTDPGRRIDQLPILPFVALNLSL